MTVFKLIVYPIGQAARLFDLNADPQEKYDLIEQGKHLEKGRNLLKKMKALQKTVGDDLSLGSYPDLIVQKGSK